jgi:hypothetical protein
MTELMSRGLLPIVRKITSDENKRRRMKLFSSFAQQRTEADFGALVAVSPVDPLRPIR